MSLLRDPDKSFMVNESDLANDYYRVVFETKELGPSVWMARGRLFRRDTDEPVRGGASARSDSEAGALAALRHQIQNTLRDLAPPQDWNNPDQVRLIVQKYIAANSRLTDTYVALENNRSHGSLSKEDLHKTFHDLRDTIRDVTLQIVAMVERLSEEDKCRLMVSDESVYTDILDPWSLDDVYARDALFKYIIEPTPKITEAHQNHHRRMLQKFASGPAATT